MTKTKYKLISVERIDNSELDSVHNRYISSIGYVDAKVGNRMFYNTCDYSIVGLGLISSIISEIKIADGKCLIVTENSIYKFKEETNEN